MRLKKFYFTIIISLMSTLTFCQEYKYLLGGSGAYCYTDNSNWEGYYSPEKEIKISGSPTFGVFIFKSLVLGLSVDISYFDQGRTGNWDRTGFEFIVSPYAKYYIQQSLFIQIQYNRRVFLDRLFYDQGWNEESYSQGGALGLGYAIGLTPRLNIEPLILYELFWRQKKQSGMDFNYRGSLINFKLGLIYTFN